METKRLQLLSDISLVFLGPGTFDDRLNAALDAIGHQMGVTHAFLFMDSPDAQGGSMTHEWCVPGVEPLRSKLQDVRYDAVPSLWHSMQEGGIVCDDVRALPEDARSFLEPLEARAILACTLILKGKAGGFIGLSERRSARHWEAGEAAFLQTVAGILSSIVEKEREQERLHSSEENFKAFFGAVDDFITIGDKDGLVLFVNPAVERYLGWAEGELIGRHILEMHPPEKREEADRILKRMFSGEIDEYPLELATKDGRSIPVSTKVWSGRWDGKECIFGISKNLRKEQEALLRFTKLFENNPMPMVISSAQDGKFIEVNRAFLEKLGYAREEVIGHTAVELQLFVNPILRQLVGGEISRKGAIKNVEMEYRCKDGTVLTGLFSGEQLDVQGVRCFLTVTVDITEKVRMRRDLAAQRQRLKNIIDGTRLATWEWNVQTGETIFNERWAEMLGYTLAELQPTSIETWEKLAHPDDLAESDRLLQKHFAGESDFYSFESRMRHKDGHWIWVWDRGAVVERDSRGMPLWMFGTHMDITEKQKMEETIRETSEQDELTRLKNRRFVMERLRELVAEHSRGHGRFCVALLGIDHFKEVNDQHGHLAGDEVLRQCAETLASCGRVYDVVGRYGGDEFIVVSAETEREHAEALMERVMETVRSKVFRCEGGELRKTLSCGIVDSAEWESPTLTTEAILEKAHRRLAAAKDAGRDRAVSVD